MKKQTIWILTVLMAVTFVGLLLLQIMYMRNMITMRYDQFNEGVRHSLNAVAVHLDQDETRYYLEQDVNSLETSAILAQYRGNPVPQHAGIKYTFTTSTGLNAALTIQGNASEINKLQMQPPTSLGFGRRNNTAFDNNYLQRKSMIDEIILNIITSAGERPIIERATPELVQKYLRTELDTLGIKVPFEYAVVNSAGRPIYKSAAFNAEDIPADDIFHQTLFAHDPDNHYSLQVYFPTKSDYIFSSVSFMVPSLAFTLILLIVFVFTIITAFRQKKLTEMKNDFINNMTHEFKTPISSISLAAQMLSDQSVRKSPAMLQQISTVINDETKRLRFQVEKVLQMSMFERQKATLRIQEVDANVVIYNIVNTFKLKVESYGGKINALLDAENAIVKVDEMHFTNVIFNLLDNAVKYRREDVPLELTVTSKDISGDRLCITVSDNGIGIKKEDLKKIFEKFFRVSTGNVHNVKGFGLGLAYVKKMVTELGGDISVESVYGDGTTFTITLPLMQD
ncbi:MAG: HAMP domain-containing histidine kinase [Muribaculaceae bacterium]|nr:HAMP domain-containing histidine kinase [Muribaculaceae bacterium]